MTAAVLSRQNRKASGLRPLDPRHDMRSVADLIESAFAHDMDPMGTRMIREMRAYGRAGWVGYMLGRLLLPASAYPKGFVWEEDHRIVGNASLLRVDGFTYRWVLANVAVADGFRRRGIGRDLTKASLDYALAHGAREIFLQVDSANQGAQVLYASLGFRPLVTYATWQGMHAQLPIRPVPLEHVREREAGEWTQQLALAERLHPEGVVWPYPLTPRIFRESLTDRLFGAREQLHWVWVDGGQMMGSLSVRYRAIQGQWRMVLLVDPDMRGRIEKHLINAALNRLSAGKREMILDYPAGIAEQDLRDLGFERKRTLTWMASRRANSGASSAY